MLSHGTACISDRAKCSTRYRMPWFERRPTSKVNITCFYFCYSIDIREEENGSQRRDLLSSEWKTTNPAHLHIDLFAACVCSYRMTLRARSHANWFPYSCAFAFLHSIVAFCAHFNSIMHNKSCSFHFCSQVCYLNMALDGAPKLCHEHWDAPIKKYSPIESMFANRSSKESRKFRRNQASEEDEIGITEAA